MRHLITVHSQKWERIVARSQIFLAYASFDGVGFLGFRF